MNASRMMKIGKSVHATARFTETHLVGVRATHLPESERVAEGVSIVRIAGSGRRGNLGRVLRLLLWQPKVYLRYRKRPVRLIAAHSVWVLPLCWLISRTTNGTLIYNAHELETETATMHGRKQRAAKLIERRLIPRCSIVSVVNEPIADWYQSAYGIARPVVVGNVPEVVEAEVGFRRQIGVDHDEMLYVHTGYLVDGRSIPVILDAFSKSNHHVAFLGDGPLKEAVTDYEDRFPNIHWIEPVPPDLIVAHVKDADVGLCLIEQQLDLSDRLSSPNKLLEALAAGIPPLCTDLVEARRHLGPLAPDWIIKNPDTELGDALRRITKEHVLAFKEAWTGLPDWDTEVSPLQTAVRNLTGPSLQTSAPEDCDERQHHQPDHPR